jgi:hypothetical protein
MSPLRTFNSSKPNATSTSRAPRRPEHAVVRVVAVLLLGTLLAGCADGDFNFSQTLDTGFKKLLSTRRSPQQQMILAVSSQDPDVRRDAIAEVSDSKKCDSEWAIKGYVAIACLDSNEQPRCIAIRALARTGDPRATETLLKILNHTDHPTHEVWPPTPLVRWDAAEGLATLSESGHVPEAQQSQVCDVLMQRLNIDTDRHARIAAARGLGEYPTPKVVKALVNGLRDDDFAVVHQCETSLVKLTGCTHHADVLAWERWLEESGDQLFAHAGEVPESRRPPYETRWQKFTYETKDLVRWLWPGTKEE